MITNEIYFFENQSSVSTSDSLYNVNDGTLILQVDGNVSNLELLVLGNTDLIDDDFVALKTINATDYSMSDKITSTGIYWIDINGIRKIKLNLSKITGSVNVKALTKRGLTTDLVARAMAANASGGSSYTLPVASASTLGGIKIGENLTIEEDGTLNASGGNDSIPTLYIYTNMNNSDIGFKYYGSTDEPTITLNKFLKNKIPFFNIMLVYNSSSTYSGTNIIIYPNWKPTDNIYDDTRSNLRFYSDVYYTTSSRGVLVNVDTDLQKDDNGNVYATFFRISVDTLNYLSKNNTTPYTPTRDYNPATKKYVDDAITTAITTSLEGRY